VQECGRAGTMAGPLTGPNLTVEPPNAPWAARQQEHARTHTHSYPLPEMGSDCNIYDSDNENAAAASGGCSE